MNFEQLTIKALLVNKNELIPDLREDLFTNANKRLYKLIIGYFSDHHKLPSTSELIAIIDSKAPEHVKAQFKALVKAIDQLDLVEDTGMLIKELKDALTVRLVDDQITQLIEAQREKESATVKSLLNQLNEKVNLSNVVITDLQDMQNAKDDHVICRSFLTEESEKQFLGGGHTGLTVYSAVSGGGKTIALLQCAINNYMSGKNVMMVSLELGKKVVYNRALSNVAEVDFTKINNSTTDDDEKKKIKEAHDVLFSKDNKNTFKIIDDTVDDSQLVNIIVTSHQVHKIDVFIIDYLQLVESSGYGDDWKMLSKLCKKLHKLTKELPITIVAASQVNVEKKAKGAVMPEISSRGSKEVIFSSSQFLFFNKDEETGGLIMFQIKNRLAQPQHLILDPKFKYMKMESFDTVIE